MKRKIITICLLGFVAVLLHAQNSVHAKALRILYIGDSITDGNWGGGGAKPSSQRNHWDKNHYYGSGFMYLCAAHYLGGYPEKQYVFYNRGISGNTLADVEKRWQEDVLDLSPDVLSVLIGINDITASIKNEKGNFDFEEWEKKYRNLIDKALTANPDLKIVLCPPFVYESKKMQEAGSWESYNHLVSKCAQVVQNIAEDYNAVYIPFNELYKNLQETYPQVEKEYWIWDGIHPTVAGHKKMADLWIEKAGELLR